MSRNSLEQIGVMLKERRGHRGIRAVAQEIGVSAATLSRIETGKQPDLETFSKICKWLGIDAGEMLGCALPEHQTPTRSLTEGEPTVSVHFRAEKAMTSETARHLGNLILAVQRAMIRNLHDDSAGS